MARESLTDLTERLLAALDHSSLSPQESGPVWGTDRAGNVTVTDLLGNGVRVEIQPSLIPGDRLRERVARAVEEAVQAVLQARQAGALPPGLPEDVVKDAEEFMATGRTAIKEKLAAAEQQIARLQHGLSTGSRPSQEH